MASVRHNTQKHNQIRSQRDQFSPKIHVNALHTKSLAMPAVHSPLHDNMCDCTKSLPLPLHTMKAVYRKMRCTAEAAYLPTKSVLFHFFPLLRQSFSLQSFHLRNADERNAKRTSTKINWRTRAGTRRTHALHANWSEDKDKMNFTTFRSSLLLPSSALPPPPPPRTTT